MPRKIIKSKLVFEGEPVEALAEVPVDELQSWGPQEKLTIVGKPTPRIDGYDKVSGTAVYTFDVMLPRMAHAKILRSPLPHARIKSIDASAAKKLPGVLGILTHENTPAIRWYRDSSVLFDPHLRYVGDDVACVAAETEAIAEEALRLIKVEYEDLPFVVDATTAMKPEAAKVHDWGNLPGWGVRTHDRGDVARGFTEAVVVVEETFTTQVVVHNPTEAHGSVVNWEGDRLTIWDSTQGVFNVRDTVARSLGIPASYVRVIKKFMGGGFGSKLDAGKYTVMAALLAKEIGRPVKIVMDRQEMNLAMGNRPDSVQKLKIGAKKDGTLVAMSHYSYGAMGAYPSGAGCAWPLRSLYRCPNIHIEEKSVLINAGQARAMRAPGHVQGTFAFESLIDDVAEKLKMDPISFRLKNYTEVDPDSGHPYTSKRLREAYEKGAAAIGWYTRRKPAGSDPGPLKRGIGMASQIWWGGGGPPAYATLKLNRDGSARVLAGTQDLGTGTHTILAQVAAEVLEIPLEKIRVTLGDSEACPYGDSSGGSMTAASVAPAVRDAAEQMKRKLLSGAAAILESPENQLRYADGIITQVSDGSKELSIADVIGKMHEEVLITTGARAANPEGYAANTFGAQFAEVEVDTETGKVRVLKVVAAHDVGRVLNPLTLENQIHGGIIQGLGYALMEERVIDEFTGKVLTTNLHDYKMPTIMDIPEIEVIVVSDSDTLLNNVGVKGVGEPAIIPTAGAIANAVYNAIGVRLKSLPMTPDKVLMAMKS